MVSNLHRANLFPPHTELDRGAWYPPQPILLVPIGGHAGSFDSCKQSVFAIDFPCFSRERGIAPGLLVPADHVRTSVGVLKVEANSLESIMFDERHGARGTLLNLIRVLEPHGMAGAALSRPSCTHGEVDRTHGLNGS